VAATEQKAHLILLAAEMGRIEPTPTATKMGSRTSAADSLHRRLCKAESSHLRQAPSEFQRERIEGRGADPSRHSSDGLAFACPENAIRMNEQAYASSAGPFEGVTCEEETDSVRGGGQPATVGECQTGGAFGLKLTADDCGPRTR
jgi:hypothetical protein